MTISWFTRENTPGTLTVNAPGGPVVVQSTPVQATALFYAPQEVPNLPGQVNPGVPYLHRVTVTGLQQGKTYNYSVAQGTESYANKLKTSPKENASVRFITGRSRSRRVWCCCRWASWEWPLAVGVAADDGLVACAYDVASDRHAAVRSTLPRNDDSPRLRELAFVGHLNRRTWPPRRMTKMSEGQPNHCFTASKLISAWTSSPIGPSMVFIPKSLRLSTNSVE